MTDYGTVGCEQYREALSARLDGEAEPVPAAATDAHLAGCPACRAWEQSAAAVTRLIRTGPAKAAPDLADRVVSAAPGRWRSRAAVLLRVALGAIGTVQLILGLLQLTTLRPAGESHAHGTTVDGATAGHLWHESAAWNVAVGAAFVWVAARRGRPTGIVPILTVFIAMLVVLSAADIWAGRVEPARLASHVFVIAGYLIVLALSRRALDLTPPGSVVGEAGQREAAEPDAPRPAKGEGAAQSADGVVIPFPGRPDRGQPAAEARWPHAA
ncbi:zf-HC2 domain-containing protein [Natronosporangium hydrolyticum]|uniref:Zf-HC2 domain-containing protein n=1 Tax=Natronosporangium hydrolyticum TaxID=2811111 RepID=A0A895YH28_9ACTN|nr:zf-HC2 domain-containing protein [Natronosporangium hydrolyticum]QSB14693.1 zf-HC2 domain-containing protein [Natronosporangium hydrolyticum]